MSEAADDGERQDDQLNAGAVMGADDKSTTSSSVPERDRIAYDDLVQRAAEFVDDGVRELDQLEPKEYHDVDAEQFRVDVCERLADAGREDTSDDGATSVSWSALFAEFGFDTPDVDGNHWVSRTQLVGAVKCSDQGIAGDAKGRITDAVDDGVLSEVRSDGGALRGYVYVGGER